MKLQLRVFTVPLAFTAVIFFLMPGVGRAQSTLNCAQCHADVYQQWKAGKHSDTQLDVAAELAEERAGESPDTVLYGSDAENCIACHSPIAVTVGGGMTEVEAMLHFFSTTNGVYTDSTKALDQENWPHNWCTTCHNVPADHPATMPTFAIFNSSTAQYDSVKNVPALCGHCHGNLRFEDTDHLTYNAWAMSKHADTQIDVAEELAEERVGESPDTVMHGSDAENCIACHGPTAVLANGGMSETEALGYFFSTQNGAFYSGTQALHQDEWPGVACVACHNPHQPELVSYFNSETKAYEVKQDAADLCGQCHGSLRFPDTDHRSYDIVKGLNAVGVEPVTTMPNADCVDCHMYTSDVDGSNSSMYHGHTWEIFVDEPGGGKTVSCAACHNSMTAAAAQAVIDTYKSQTAAKLDSAETLFSVADSVMAGNSDSQLQAKLEEAANNLFLVQSDESGGFHNHKFQMKLLDDVIQKSKEILAATGVEEQPASTLPGEYRLDQNYPNPFNPRTDISFALKAPGRVRLSVFDASGRLVRVLVDTKLAAGPHKVTLNAGNLPSGLYFYRLKVNGFTATRKMLLLK